MTFKYSVPFDTILKPIQNSLNENVRELIQLTAKLNISVPVTEHIKFTIIKKVNNYEFEERFNF